MNEFTEFIQKPVPMISVGRDVTTTKPQGPVEIESGSTIIKAKNVTIKNNFEVTFGAELNIGQ